MEQIWNQVMERLSNPEVLFGLGVRFFGVFIVLIIVMIVLYLTGWVFQRMERKTEEASSPTDPAPSPPEPEPTSVETPTGVVSTSPGSTVPDEVAIAIALAMVPDEVAVAVALALNEATEAQSLAPRPLAQAGARTAWEEPGSAWKLVGRQQALYQKTSLTRDITPKSE
jgi:hypothetical protein